MFLCILLFSMEFNFLFYMVSFFNTNKMSIVSCQISNYRRFDNFSKVVKSRTTADLTTCWKWSNLELPQIWQLVESCQISNWLGEW